ncbi:Hypothetical predicted protein, partial [Mytilus galloprovincialis]
SVHFSQRDRLKFLVKKLKVQQKKRHKPQARLTGIRRDPYTPYQKTVPCINKDRQPARLLRSATYGRVQYPAIPLLKIYVALRSNLLLHTILFRGQLIPPLATPVPESWTDALLVWNASEHDDINIIRVPSDLIWIPDIVLYNFADPRLEEKRDVLVLVEPNGHIFWMPQAILRSSCSFDTTYFPFDEQYCHLKFGSWTYDGTKLDLFFFQNLTQFSLSDYIASTEWTIIENVAKKFEKFYDCCPNTPFPDLKFYLRMKRNVAFYSFILILPCSLLSLLTLVIFWVPPESPAKLVLGMNIFVAFFVLLLLLAESTPKAADSVPLIGTYFCLSMILITVSTVLSTIVANMFFRGVRINRAPLWLRKLMIDVVARLFCIRDKLVENEERNDETVRNLWSMKMSSDKNNCNAAEEKGARVRLLAEKKEEFYRSDIYENGQPNGDIDFSIPMRSGLAEDIRVIREILEKYQDQKKRNEIREKHIREWKVICCITDRLFFLLYLLININMDIEKLNQKLCWAAEEGSLDKVKECVALNADLEYKIDGWVPLMYAAGYGHLDVLKYLLLEGSDIEVRDRKGVTPLLCATREGFLTVIQHLVTAGSDLHVRDFARSMTPLMYAAEWGHLKVLEYLISKQCDINARDQEGRTALHWAAKNGNVEINKWLIEVGRINPLLKTSAGATPYDIAEDAKNIEVMEYLKIVMSKKAEFVHGLPNEPETHGSIPATILRMDKNSIRIYMNALKSGAEIKHDLRIIIVGKKGAGKTSLVKNLLKKKRVAHVKSTNGIDIHVKRCKIRTADGKWSFETDNVIANVNQRIMRSIITQTMKDEYLGHRVKSTFHEEVKTSNQSKYTSEKDRLQAKIKTQDLTDLHESLRNPKPLSATDKLYKKELQELVDSIKHIEKEEYVSVSLWDFAGDKEFYNTHQTFFSEEAIYLVVTKLNETDDETNETLKFWFDSIHFYGTKHNGNIEEMKQIRSQELRLEPPIIAIGTHKDMCTV